MRSRYFVAIPALLLTAAWAQTQKQSAHAEIVNAKGEKIGTATLQEAMGGVQVGLQVAQLPPGTHALHVHAVGKCEGPEFKTAGPHFNPEGKKHGSQNPEGPHAGDLPNFEVGQDGNAKTSVLASRMTLGDGPNSLFHPDGTALVIHEKADDYKTDPAGNAGARIACGVVEK